MLIHNLLRHVRLHIASNTTLASNHNSLRYALKPVQAFSCSFCSSSTTEDKHHAKQKNDEHKQRKDTDPSVESGASSTAKAEAKPSVETTEDWEKLAKEWQAAWKALAESEEFELKAKASRKNKEIKAEEIRDEKKKDSSSSVPTFAKLSRTHSLYGTGGRKSSQAQVWIQKGVGEFYVNRRPLQEYFQFSDEYIGHVLEPLKAASLIHKVQVNAIVAGGGLTGQSGALRHGLSRALAENLPEFRQVLRANGYMTRDSRVVERKKPGQAKARKKYQWAKR